MRRLCKQVSLDPLRATIIKHRQPPSDYERPRSSRRHAGQKIASESNNYDNDRFEKNRIWWHGAGDDPMEKLDLTEVTGWAGEDISFCGVRRWWLHRVSRNGCGEPDSPAPPAWLWIRFRAVIVEAVVLRLWPRLSGEWLWMFFFDVVVDKILVLTEDTISDCGCRYHCVVIVVCPFWVDYEWFYLYIKTDIFPTTNMHKIFGCGCGSGLLWQWIFCDC